MTFWLIAGGLALFVVLVLVATALRTGADDSAPGSHDLAVYEDQLAELARDRARGAILDAEADDAEAEIKRRMIAAADAQAEAAASSRRGRLTLPNAILLAAGAPIAGIAIYLAVGRPDLAEDPGARARGPTADDIRRAQGMSAKDRAAMIRGMVEGLAARLKANPGDFAGWLRLGRAWMVLREWSKAADAYTQALKLKPKDPTALGGFVAARLRSLPPQAPLTADLRAAVGRLRAVQPEHPLALYLGGLVAVQEGRPKEAVALWKRLLARLPENSPLAPVLRRRIGELEAGGTKKSPK